MARFDPSHVTIVQKTLWIINQYASTPQTGMGGRHYYLAKELGKLGYRVYVVAASYTHLLHDPPVVQRSVTVEQREEINMVWIKTPRYAQAHSIGRIWNWFLFSHKLRELPRHISAMPDVVFYSSPSLVGYLGAEKLARSLGARLAFEVRDIWPLTLCEIGGYSPKHPFIRYLQWVENKAYRNSDIVFSNLKNANVHMIQHGLTPDKFHWIPNGILLEEVRRSAALTPGVLSTIQHRGFVVGYTGTLGIANRLDILIAAARILKGRKDISFVLIGEGSESAALQKQVRDYELDNVVFTGAIAKSRIQTALSKMDVTYIGLANEGLFRFGVSPNKLFDYLYAGKPIIFGINSGTYHPVADAEAGLEIQPEDPQALADAIVKLAAMPREQRDRMGQNGRKAVLAEYEYSVLANKFANELFPSAS